MLKKETVTSFLRSSSFRLLLWIQFWLVELFSLKWLMEHNIIPERIIDSIDIVLAALGAFLLIYWILEKQSTEMPMYILLTAAFVVNGLYVPEKFQFLFRRPITELKFWILGFAIFRLTICRWLISALIAIKDGVVQYLNEQAAERAKNKAELEQQRLQRLNNRKNRHKISQEHAQARWTYFFNTIKSIFDGIKGCFTALGKGLEESRAVHTDTSEVGDTEQGKKVIIIRNTALIVIYFLVLLGIVYLIWLILRLSNTTTDKSYWVNIFDSVQTAPERVALLIELAIIIVVLIVVVITLAAIIVISLIQIYDFIRTIVADLSSSKGDRSITTPIIFTMTGAGVLYWLVKNYPFDEESLADALTSGRFVVYPLGFVLLCIIVSFFARGITEEKIKAEMKKTHVQDVVGDIIGLAFNSIKSVVSYLKIVTGDFLSSILELADEDKIEDDLEADEYCDS